MQEQFRNSRSLSKMAAESRPVVTALNLFPLKSGKAVEMQELRVGNYGAVDDRRFMIVDGTTNRFLHQRRIPKMALIRAVYVTVNDKQALRLSAPGVPDLTLEPRLEGEVREVGVWQQTAPAVDQGDEAAAWFSNFLGPAAEYARLVRVLEGDPKSRPIKDLPDNVRKALSDMHVAFQDSAPLTIISHESLADLNSRLKERTGEEVPMNRFRMNIEVKGCSKAFEEDEWFLVEIGSVSFMVYEVTERCKMTCNNQDTGEMDKFGPLDILRTYRAPKGPTHAMFGMKLVPLKSDGVIRVGDTVTVLERRKQV